MFIILEMFCIKVKKKPIYYPILLSIKSFQELGKEDIAGIYVCTVYKVATK